jgi:hypothetical protein
MYDLGMAEGQLDQTRHSARCPAWCNGVLRYSRSFLLLGIAIASYELLSDSSVAKLHIAFVIRDDKKHKLSVVVKKFREISVTQLKIKATNKEKIQSVKQMHLDNCSRLIAALWTTKDH